MVRKVFLEYFIAEHVHPLMATIRAILWAVQLVRALRGPRGERTPERGHKQTEWDQPKLFGWSWLKLEVAGFIWSPRQATP